MSPFLGDLPASLTSVEEVNSWTLAGMRMGWGWEIWIQQTSIDKYHSNIPNS